MSIATECPPDVFIPERARRSTTESLGSARTRHLVAVPGRTLPTDFGTTPRRSGPPVTARPLPAGAPGVGGTHLVGLRTRGGWAIPVDPGSVDSGRAVSRRAGSGRPTSRSVDHQPTVAPAAVRLTRRGMVALTLVALALGALLLVVAHATAGSAAAHQPIVAAGTNITVQRGDTLWSIAERVAPNRDPQQVVDQLRQVNRLASVTLIAGQTLKVG